MASRWPALTELLARYVCFHESPGRRVVAAQQSEQDVLGADDPFAACDRLPQRELERFLRCPVERDVTEAVRDAPPIGTLPVEHPLAEGGFETAPDLVEIDPDRFERRGVLVTERGVGGAGGPVGAEPVDGETFLREQDPQRFVRGDSGPDEQVRRLDPGIAHPDRLLLRCDDNGSGTVGESFEHVDHLRFRLCF